MFNLTQGKSTFVSFLEEASNENKWEITKEPVSLWTKKINDETSLLERYYTGQGSCFTSSFIIRPSFCFGIRAQRSLTKIQNDGHTLLNRQRS